MKLGVIAGLMVLSCGVAFSISSVEKPKENSWHFVRPELWLGTLTNEQAVPVTFEIKNDSDKPLKIVSTDVSCRCTTLDFAPGEIPAHGSGLFKWIFSASRSMGSVKNTVTVEAADGRTIIGTFKAFVEQPSSGSGASRSDS